MQPCFVSADAHVVEPPVVFAAVAKRFGLPAPRLFETPGEGWLLDTGFGRVSQPGRFATAGLEPGSVAYVAQEHSGYGRASLHSCEARLADMDRDGVRAEVLFPTLLARHLAKRDRDAAVTQALLASYNDWVADYCTQAPDRLFPVACIQTADLGSAVAELERARRVGHVAALLPSGAPERRPYSDPAYDALWAAARALDMPVTFHASFAPERENRPPAFQRNGLGFTLLHVDAMLLVSDLILGGVCDRFPGIRFVLTEFETGWLAHFLARTQKRNRRKLAAGALSMPFGDVWRRNFRATFEDDPFGIATRDAIGVETLMWGSDYPHGNSTWPESCNTLARLLADCKPDERRALTAGNAIALYGLPFPA